MPIFLSRILLFFAKHPSIILIFCMFGMLWVQKINIEHARESAAKSRAELQKLETMFESAQKAYSESLESRDAALAGLDRASKALTSAQERAQQQAVTLSAALRNVDAETNNCLSRPLPSDVVRSLP